jgi:hypothetical protein
MSQQEPQQPPQYPAPQYAPQPEPKKRKGKGCLYAFIGFVAVGVVAVAASSNGSKGTSDDSAPSHNARPTLTAGKDAAPAQTPVQAFKAYVNKNGTATEQAAVKHVTKIQGADKKNDILDTADIYTDYSGGLMGPHGSDGKLLASAFTDWQTSRGKDSKNGLVTVYDKTGEILSNGNY